MPVFGRGRGPKTAPSAEYVAAGGDLALVRVQGAGSPSAELLVRSGGREQRFDALAGPPGDDRIAFPVPLELVRSSGCELRLVADGEEVALAPPPEVHPELAEARAELRRGGRARGGAGGGARRAAAGARAPGGAGARGGAARDRRRVAHARGRHAARADRARRARA